MTSVTEVKTTLQDIRILQLSPDDKWFQNQRGIIKLISSLRFRTLRSQIHEFVVFHSQVVEPEKFERDRLERELLEPERIARLWRFLEHLVLLLLSTLRFLLSCRKFGGFQNRQRPRCTTMPWTIWPSLVVLWGVCWMFVNTPVIEFDPTRVNSVFDDEQLSLFVPNLSLDPRFTPNLGDFNQFVGNFEFGNALNDAVYAHAPYLDRQNLNDISVGSLKQNYQGQTSPREVVECFTYSESPPGDSSSHPVDEVKGTATADFQIRQLHMNVCQGANTHINKYPPASLPVMEAILSRPNSESTLPQQTSIVSKQQQIPPRNAEGKLICKDHGCRDKSFSRYCDWQTHVNKHKRPFRCSIDGCPSSISGFATKGVRDRHVIRVHQRSRSASSGTARSIGAEMIGGVSAKLTESFVASDQKKRKGLSSDDFHDQEAKKAGQQDAIAENVPKRVKVVIQGHDEMARTTPNVEDLVKQNEMLQEQLDKAREDLDTCRKEREREREMMLGIIDQLTKLAK